MKKSRKLMAILMAAVMMLGVLAGCGESSAPEDSGGDTSSADSTDTGGEKIVLKAGHIVTEDHHYQLGLERFAELVAEGTEGRVEIEVYANGTLGYEREMLEGMQMGTVDMGCITSAPFSNFTDVLELFDMPFLFETREHAYKVLDSSIGQDILTSLEDFGFIALAYWENGFREIQTVEKYPIEVPSDLHGVKIRCMESAVYLETLNALGASPIAMSFGEVYTALQQGTIDGGENTIVGNYQGKIHEVSPNVTMTNQIYSPAVLTISKTVWDKISPEDQEVMRQAAIETTDYQREQSQRLEEEDLAAMKEEGCNIIEIDYDVWREAVQPVYDAEYDRFGEDILNEIASMAE